VQDDDYFLLLLCWRSIKANNVTVSKCFWSEPRTYLIIRSRRLCKKGRGNTEYLMRSCTLHSIKYAWIYGVCITVIRARVHCTFQRQRGSSFQHAADQRCMWCRNAEVLLCIQVRYYAVANPVPELSRRRHWAMATAWRLHRQPFDCTHWTWPCCTTQSHMAAQVEARVR
jgi:hypothetical protein